MPSLCCVHPHPDDESIACGGLLARSVDRGHAVHVVTCTGGEEGENQAGIDLGGQQMGEVRRAEMAAALDRLGVAGHTWLGYRDSGMAGEPANTHPDAFAAADLDEAAGRLARVLRRVRPDVVVSDGPDGTYGHPDHVRAHDVTVRAVELAADPGFVADDPPWEVAKRYVHALSRERMFAAQRRLAEEGLASPFGEDPPASPEDLPFGRPQSEITTTVDVAPWYDRKRAAMAAHASQIGPDSFFLNLPVDLAGALFGVEELVWADGRVPAADGEDDPLAGL